MRDSVKIAIACIVCLGVVGAAGIYVYFSRNKNVDRNIVTRINEETNALEWQFEGDGSSEWKVLMQLDSLKGSDGETPDIVNENGVIGYYDENDEFIPIISTQDLAGTQGKTGAQGAQGAQGEAGDQGIQGIQGEKGEDGRTPEFRVNGEFVQWRYVGEENWKTLVSLDALTGNSGSDGRSVEIRNNGTDIVWRYLGDNDSPWRPIVQVDALKGETGPTGVPGKDGINGREVDIKTIDNIVKWKYVDEGDDAWRSLVAMADITGVPGTNGQSVGLRVDTVTNEIQWKYTNEDAWTTLISLDALKGDKGDTGATGVPGENGKKLEVKKFDARPPVAEDPANNITSFPGREAMIMYRYEGEGEDAWKELVKLSEINGKDAALTDIGDLRVQKDVQIGVDATSGDPILEDQIQYKGKNDPNEEASWKRLCSLGDLNVTLPDPEPKEFYSSTGDSITLDSTKNYLVTMTLSGSNDTSDVFTASVSCNGSNSVSGTWLAAIPDSTDPAVTTPYVNSVTTSFIVTSTGSLSFDTSNANGMALSVTVAEV